MQVRNAGLSNTTYAAAGSSVQPGDQFMITEDSIQVVDLLIVGIVFFAIGFFLFLYAYCERLVE